eukprot:4875745-Pleurochrysis_carterae.AAC.1
MEAWPPGSKSLQAVGPGGVEEHLIEGTRPISNAPNGLGDQGHFECPNKQRKKKCEREVCHSAARKKHKTAKMATEHLLNNPDPNIRQSTRRKHASQYHNFVDVQFKVNSIEELLVGGVLKGGDK